LLSATENSTSISYVYDKLGRATQFTDQAGRVSSYTFDQVGNRLNTTYPTSIVVKREVDNSNRLKKLKDASNVVIADYTQDDLGRTTGVSLGNGTSVAASYDLLNRLTSLNNTLNGTSRNNAYAYNNAGMRTSETNNRGTVAFGYNSRYEVTGVTEPSGSPFADQEFSYDDAYNRLTWKLGSVTTNYVVNNLNQYTTVSSHTAPSWNGNGNLATFNGKTVSVKYSTPWNKVDDIVDVVGIGL
jgi:YD repeat-containing protein